MSSGDNPKRRLPRRFVTNITLFNRNEGYKFTKSQENITYFMNMDYIKLFTKIKKRTRDSDKTVRIYKQNIVMEVGIEKYAMHIRKQWKRKITEGIELSNGKSIKKL